MDWSACGQIGRHQQPKNNQNIIVQNNQNNTMAQPTDPQVALQMAQQEMEYRVELFNKYAIIVHHLEGNNFYPNRHNTILQNGF